MGEKEYTVFSEFKLNLNRLVATYYIMSSNETLLAHCYTFFAECNALNSDAVDLIFLRDIKQNGAKMVDFFEKVYSAKLEKVDA